jgi:hypothetical protein
MGKETVQADIFDYLCWHEDVTIMVPKSKLPHEKIVNMVL